MPSSAYARAVAHGRANPRRSTVDARDSLWHAKYVACDTAKTHAWPVVADIEKHACCALRCEMTCVVATRASARIRHQGLETARWMRRWKVFQMCCSVLQMHLPSNALCGVADARGSGADANAALARVVDVAHVYEVICATITRRCE